MLELIAKNIYPIIITAINISIIISLFLSFRIHYVARRFDTVFHSRMLLLCTLLLLANTFALITSVYAYFILQRNIPSVLNFGRFADRYCMFFAYLVLQKILTRSDD